MLFPSLTSVVPYQAKLTVHLELSIMEKQQNDSFTAQFAHFHAVVQVTAKKTKTVFFKHVVRLKLLFFHFPYTKHLDGIFYKL